MSRDLDCTQLVSMKLSEVLSDIGLNDRIVEKRRRTYLLHESLNTSLMHLGDLNCSAYIFGSKPEGTTTPGLKSDTDHLCCYDYFHAIQDMSEWKHGVTTYLMIHDQTVQPGYCLLQLLRKDVPDPETNVPDEQHFRDRSGRILLRNTIFRAATKTAAASLAASYYSTEETNGPAHTLSTHGYDDRDVVTAVHCKSWPMQAKQWNDEGRWPSKRVKTDYSKTGCFVVGVASNGSENHELEWRISTSLAERCLMFSLNITQIRCYVLMKILLKTYIKPYYEDAISSYMCKTALIQSIANTRSKFWKESNLITRLSWCLLALYNYVLNENCPHFIIPENNLMAGHITHESKPKVLGTLLHILKHIKEVLFSIDCDNLGARLWHSFFNIGPFYSMNSIISGQLSFNTALRINSTIFDSLVSIKTCSNEVATQTLLKYIFKLKSIYHQDHEHYQKAYMLLAQLFNATLGSALASLSIELNITLPADVLDLISMNLDTDVSSSKLKQASMFYCIGDMQRTEKILRDINENYDINIVEPTCACYIFKRQLQRRGFLAVSDKNEEALQSISAFCAIYLPCEINCILIELRYEMFRSTKDDIPFRIRMDHWMDLAVVDSLPYLYFLQYKTYSYLRRQDDKQRALSNLLKTIKEEPNLGHRETALNLLGQCMEDEDKVNDASNCYVVSLSLRERHNAAKVHICRLVSKLIKNRLETNHSKGAFGDVVPQGKCLEMKAN